jgi:hypothetical protein
MNFIQNLSLTDPSPRLLRALADAIEADRNASSATTGIGRALTFTKKYAELPFQPETGTFTAHSGPGLPSGPNVAAAIDNDTASNATTGEEAGRTSTTQANPLGNEGSAFAAPKRRGRPPKIPPVVMPNGVVLNPPEPEEVDITPLVEEVQETIARVNTVPDTATMHKALEAYVGAFKIAGAKALLAREGVAKLGELSDGRKTVVVQEMLDAVEMGVPVVAV